MNAQPLDEQIDHLRGPAGGPVILMYGDYECPYSRLAMREIERVQADDDRVRFAFRHFPLTDIHPHALAASLAAEAAAHQQRFWDMHDLLFHRQKALADLDLARYAGELGLDVERFERDRGGEEAIARVRRDVDSGLQAGVAGTPALFLDGAPYAQSYAADELRAALAGR